MWKILIDSYHQRILLEQETSFLTRQISIQQTHYRELTKQIDESIRLRHDHRHHLQTIFSYLEQNKVADAILQYYKTQCLSRHIQFECVASLPADTGIPDTDFSILLGNLLENALEAASLVTTETPTIKIQIQTKKNSIIARIQNNYERSVKREKKQFYSTKHKGKGIGTNSARIIVEKYQGAIDFENTEKEFRVSFVLPLSSPI